MPKLSFDFLFRKKLSWAQFANFMAKRPGMSDFFFGYTVDFIRSAALRRCNRGTYRAFCRDSALFADGAIPRVASDRFFQIGKINELVRLATKLIGDHGLRGLQC